MELETLTIAIAGLYIFYKEIKHNQLLEKVANYEEMVAVMAKELQELGSPNIKIIKKEDNETIPKN